MNDETTQKETLMDIIYNDTFTQTPLDKLSAYYDGWQITLRPTDEEAKIELAPFRRGETSFAIGEGKELVLASILADVADPTPLLNYLKECEEALKAIVEGHEFEWNVQKSKYMGTLTEEAREAYEDLYASLEIRFRPASDSLSVYWDAWDWFDPAPPEKGDRDAAFLVADALQEGVYLDLQEVQDYLEQLTEDETENC
jgi:hypothetical protein